MYRGLQVGYHKFATKIHACATFGGIYYYYYYYDIEHTTEGAVCVRVGIWGENDKKLRSSNSI